MVFMDTQKVMYDTHMLVEEMEYWWDNACQRLEATCIEITWENLKTNFLYKYFSTDVYSKKGIKFLELKQGNMMLQIMLLDSKVV